MSNLTMPLMVYWDVCSVDGPDAHRTPGASDAGPDLIDKICRDLVSSGIFILNLQECGTELSETTRNILRNLKNSPIQVLFTLHGAAMEQVAEILPVSRLKRLLFRVESLDELKSLSGAFPHYSRYTALGLSIAIHEDNLAAVPPILEFCLGNEDLKGGVHEVQIARAGVAGGIFTSRMIKNPEAIKELAREISRLPVEKLNILIHDPFLWPVFARGKQQNVEGCNAAQTMLYIRPDLEVTPCPIVPLSLGDLRRMNLREIFSSEEKRRFREMLSNKPPDCSRCPEVNVCRGGCRGRALVLLGSLDQKDPACG
jgi:GeoRSP system SPASM domain protein